MSRIYGQHYCSIAQPRSFAVNCYDNIIAQHDVACCAAMHKCHDALEFFAKRTGVCAVARCGHPP